MICNEFEMCLNRTDAKRKKIKPVMWDDYEAFVIPNISREKWVSCHTDLGSHEAFLMTYVHIKLITERTEKQRFLVIFVIRAHCRKEVFELVQFAQMQSACFWASPLTAFRYPCYIAEQQRHRCCLRRSVPYRPGNCPMTMRI